MKEKKIIDADMRGALRAPFPDEAYSGHPTKTFLTVLKAMYVTERLNDVFGLGRWTVEHEIIERTEDYVLIQSEFHSLDYDVSVPKQYGGHKTTGKNTEIADGYKSALTDSISKIASYLEIGIDMFKGKVNKKAAPKNDPNDKRPWLNKSDGKRETPQWHNVLTAIANGTVKSLKDLEPHYKVNKMTQAEIDLAIKTHNLKTK